MRDAAFDVGEVAQAIPEHLPRRLLDAAVALGIVEPVDRVLPARPPEQPRIVRAHGLPRGAAEALALRVFGDRELVQVGQALLALRGYRSASVDKALLSAEQHLARAQSVEATVWLRLGLLAHGRRVERECPECRGTLDLSLRLILDAVERGVDVFA